MATIIGGAIGLDFSQLDLPSVFAGTVITRMASQYATSGNGYVDRLFGNLQYDASGAPSGGVITRFQETYGGQVVFDITDLNVNMTSVKTWAAVGATFEMMSSVLSGADSILGSSSHDRLEGFSGADTMFAAAGNDTLFGGSGRNDLRGGDGSDNVRGGLDGEFIHGNKGEDTLYAGGTDLFPTGTVPSLGADTIRGGQGNDSVQGANGADWLSGDRGTDTIQGGGGADVFNTFSGAGLDRVLDFRVSEGDRVHIEVPTPYSVSQVGLDTVISLGTGDSMVLVGVQQSTLPSGWIFT